LTIYLVLPLGFDWIIPAKFIRFEALLDWQNVFQKLAIKDTCDAYTGCCLGCGFARLLFMP